MKFIVTTALALMIAAPAVAHETPAGKTAETTTAPQKSKASEAGLVAKSHSGGTDSKGCHTNHKTGDYHCHKPK
jgi:hypothetical protein